MELTTSSALPCLFPFCHEKVRFDLGSANGNGPTPRAHSRCANGHPHYAEDNVRYGTDREQLSEGTVLMPPEPVMADDYAQDHGYAQDRRLRANQRL